MPQQSDITDFNLEVIRRSHSIPVLVDFWAPWCGACRVLSPQLEVLRRRHQNDWVLVKVNADNHPDLSERYRISSIPSIRLFVDGKVIGELTGALPGHTIEQWLAKTLPSPAKRTLQQAHRFMSEGLTMEAQRTLEQLLSAEPDHLPAKVLLARLIVMRDPSRAYRMVEHIEPIGQIGRLADAVKTIADCMIRFYNAQDLPQSPAEKPFFLAISALYANLLDSALENFIASLEADPHFLDGYAREVSIALFKYLGEEHELTKKYRHKLGAVLYR